MNKYELVVIINGQLPADQKDPIFKQATDYVSKSGGKVINNQVWLDKHKMAFPVKKCQEGTYYLINFEAASAAISQIREALRLNENILRYSFINVGK